jgi:hypothetical protein
MLYPIKGQGIIAKALIEEGSNQVEGNNLWLLQWEMAAILCLIEDSQYVGNNYVWRQILDNMRFGKSGPAP